MNNTLYGPSVGEQVAERLQGWRGGWWYLAWPLVYVAFSAWLPERLLGMEHGILGLMLTVASTDLLAGLLYGDTGRGRLRLMARSVIATLLTVLPLWVWYAVVGSEPMAQLFQHPEILGGMLGWMFYRAWVFSWLRAAQTTCACLPAREAKWVAFWENLAMGLFWTVVAMAMYTLALGLSAFAMHVGVMGVERWVGEPMGFSVCYALGAAAIYWVHRCHVLMERLVRSLQAVVRFLLWPVAVFVVLAALVWLVASVAHGRVEGVSVPLTAAMVAWLLFGWQTLRGAKLDGDTHVSVRGTCLLRSAYVASGLLLVASGAHLLFDAHRMVGWHRLCDVSAWRTGVHLLNVMPLMTWTVVLLAWLSYHHWLRAPEGVQRFADDLNAGRRTFWVYLVAMVLVVNPWTLSPAMAHRAIHHLIDGHHCEVLRPPHAVHVVVQHPAEAAPSVTAPEATQKTATVAKKVPVQKTVKVAHASVQVPQPVPAKPVVEHVHPTTSS